jgi:hypothetical protein
MRVLEILLPKGTTDRSLSPKHIQKIDFLQQRMNGYVDKIFDPNTTDAGREFLKSRLRDDYYELRELIPQIHHIAEAEKKYEIFDKDTGKKVAGPYTDLNRVKWTLEELRAVYKKKHFGHRPVKECIQEAIRKLPISDKDFELVKKLMERPIPAAIAPIYISEIIDDDMLNDEIRSFEDTDPGRDCRPFVVEWIKRVMPDQLHRFGQEVADWKERDGKFSPLHGYDPCQNKGTNDPITGNAYGMR